MNRGYYRSSYPRRGWTAPYNGGWIGRRPSAFRLTGTKRTTRDTIKKVQRDVKFLKHVIEIKQVDATLPTGPIPSFVGSNDTTHVINATLVGPGMWQRIGNRINLKELEVCMNITHMSTRHEDQATMVPNEYRIAVVYDKLTTNFSGSGVPATKPNFNQMFMERNLSGTTATHWMSPKNPDVGDRYVILYDKKRAANQPFMNTMMNTVSDPDTPAVQYQYLVEHFKINLRGRPTVYNAAQEITEGALYIVLIALYHQTDLSSDPLVNTINIGTNYCRLRYYDS